VDDRDILCALQAVQRMQGGLVVCAGRRVRGAVALPIAGLMTDAPLAQVTSAFRALHASARVLGSRPERPFMALSFLALPVIPELRLTDRGLVDVAHACHVPLYVA
jgi:adenine deaminase